MFSRVLRATARPLARRALSTAVASAPKVARFVVPSLVVVCGVVGTTVGVAACDGPLPKLPVYGAPGTSRERTFLAVKPDGVQRNLVGDIIGRFEKR